MIVACPALQGGNPDEILDPERWQGVSVHGVPVDVSSVNLKSIPWHIRVNYKQNVPNIRKMEIVGKNNPEHYPGTTAVTGDHIPIPR